MNEFEAQIIFNCQKPRRPSQLEMMFSDYSYGHVVRTASRLAKLEKLAKSKSPLGIFYIATDVGLKEVKEFFEKNLITTTATVENSE